ncbi:hypothetical protein JKP88DRAFT_218793 [Tribonema minus]|uniref:Uncharacterized protein n=1 Tax=Tribonema minus TaxID=303371 RepID=A0A835Z515_9STRA|nr:hypothetical protein JKP88DRAFT_218793 [Tribonema minus]
MGQAGRAVASAVLLLAATRADAFCQATRPARHLSSRDPHAAPANCGAARLCRIETRYTHAVCRNAAEDDDAHDTASDAPTDDDGPVFMIRNVESAADRATRFGDDGDMQMPDGEATGWGKVEEALGLSTLSYLGLGLAVVIILFNNLLGPGWAGRLWEGQELSPQPEMNLPYTVVPLNKPENILQ